MTAHAYAVITGANRGIGRAIAVALAARGLGVALLVRRESSADALLPLLAAYGSPVRALACDVTSEGAIDQAALRLLSDWGPPQVVVNNAGIVRRDLVHQQSLDDFRAVLDTNLTGAFLVTRAFLPSMLRKGTGRVIQIASISATLGSPRAAAYNASKWGLVGWTKSLAEELRGTGLMAVSVLPGAVDTDMLVGSGFAPAMTSEDVAGTVAYAALDAPIAMNGSALEIFG